MLTPDHDSGSVRTQAMLELAIEAGAKVTFVGDNLEYREPYVRDLQARGVEVLYAPYVSSVTEILDRRGREFDLVVVARHYVAVKYVDAIRRFAPQARLIFDTVDLHYLREQLRGTRRQRRTGAPSGALAHAGAEIDARVRRHAGGQRGGEGIARARSTACARGGAVERARGVRLSARFRRARDLVFIGGFQHPPNIDAVLWFVREVLPQVREALPGIAFHMVGSKVTPTILSLADDDVVVHRLRRGPRAVLDRLPPVDRAAALRRGRQGQGQPGDELRPAGHRHASRRRRHARAVGEDVMVADDPARSRKRSCASTGRGAVAEAGRGRCRQHPAPIFARRGGAALGERTRSPTPDGTLSPGEEQVEHAWPSFSRAPRTWSAAARPVAARSRPRCSRAAAPPRASRESPARTPPSRSRRAGSRRGRAAARARARTPACSSRRL